MNTNSSSQAVKQSSSQAVKQSSSQAVKQSSSKSIFSIIFSLIFLLLSNTKVFSQLAIGSSDADYGGYLYHRNGVCLGTDLSPSYDLLIAKKQLSEQQIFMQIANASLTGYTSTDGFLIGINRDTAIINQQENADIIFKTNATNRSIIKNNGYVGIGIMNPAHILHVHGTGTTSGGTSGEVGVSTGHDFAKSSSTENNKGLGWGSLNLPPIQPSPYAAIQLTNNATGTTVNDGLLFEIKNNDATINLQEQGSISFRNSGKTSMEITKENNIKIGSITSPNTNIKVDISTLHKNGLLITTLNNSDGYIFKAKSNNNSNVLVVKSNGRIGIGTDNPVEALQVKGGVRVEHTTTYDWSYALSVWVNRDKTKAFTVNRTSGENLFTIWGNGVVSAKTLYAEKMEVRTDALSIFWPDFVFEKDYKLQDLKSLEKYITEHKHLPGVPSSEDIKKKGSIDLAEMNRILLKKVEELTLYIIQQQKEIEKLKKNKCDNYLMSK